jgi:hypothetical protein
MIYIEQSFLRDVSVYLCSRQISMTEEFLDAAEVCATIE